MAKTLVFLEHHEGAIQKGSLGVLAKAAQLGGEVAGVVSAPDVRASPRGGRRRRRCGSPTTTRLAAPLPQPRVDVLAKLVRDEGYDTVLFAQSVLAADVAAGLAARLDAGLNWGLVDFDGDGTGTAPQLQDTVVVDVGWSTPVRIGDLPRGRARRRRALGGTRRGARTRRSSSRTSRRRPRWSSRRTRSSRARRSRTPT